MSMRLLRLPAVITMTGLGRSAIYDRVKRGKFPRPVPITTRAVAWVEAEVAAWVQERIDSARAA